VKPQCTLLAVFLGSLWQLLAGKLDISVVVDRGTGGKGFRTCNSLRRRLGEYRSCDM